jgi:hypothetical protein
MAAKQRLHPTIRQQLEAAFYEALRRHNESRGSGARRKKKAPARKKKTGRKKAGKKKVARKRPTRRR